MPRLPCTNRRTAAAAPARASLRAAGLAVVAATIVALASCADESRRCASGACPFGYSCDPATGTCRRETAAPAGRIGLFGRFTTLPRPGAAPVAVGFSAEHKSLAVVDGTAVSFLAGPGAAAGAAPDGQANAAAPLADGRIAVAWLSAAGGAIQVAQGKGAQWARAPIPAPAAGAVAAPIAIAASGGRIGVAVRDKVRNGVRLLSAAPGADWVAHEMPMPPSPRAGEPPSSDVGRSIGLVALPKGFAIATYDATYGDLVLGVHDGDEWSLARAAGVDAVTSVDTGDAGDSVALALAPDGTLVVAYRDRTRGAVMVARAKDGTLAVEQAVAAVATGPAGTQRSELAGTALALAVRADGRAAVAWFNGSTLRVGLALQRATGGYAERSLPALATAGLQMFPALAVGADGAVWLSWIDNQVGRVPNAARVVHAVVGAEAWP